MLRLPLLRGLRLRLELLHGLHGLLLVRVLRLCGLRQLLLLLLLGRVWLPHGWGQLLVLVARWRVDCGAWLPPVLAAGCKLLLSH